MASHYQMEFWGVEVKVGQALKVDQGELGDATIHLSKVALSEAKKGVASEPVVVYLKVGNQKFVLGTLSRDNIPQFSVDLYLNKEFELSHSSKNASVYFCGYKVENDDDLSSDFSDSDEDLPQLNKENGKIEKKVKEAKVIESKKPLVSNGTSAKQVKISDPKKDEEHESDDESDEEDEFGSSDEEMDADSDSYEESESDEDEDDEDTPAKKVDQGKKRPNESASRTPVPTKKAKNTTPEKTDGKKSVHTATPHPMKKVGKSPNSVGKDQTPKSGGQLSGKSHNKSFTSKSGPEQHKKTKHGRR